MLIRRIDHPIVCVRDRRGWVDTFKRVLDLEPLAAREGDEWGFSNAEIAVGDGLVGIVEPAGEGSHLTKFLAAHGEGYYALSVDVGDLDRAAAHFRAHDVPFREAKRDGRTTLLWVAPRSACGVLYQISPGMKIQPGTNPLYEGIPEVVIGVESAEAGRDRYRTVFGFENWEPVESHHLGYRGYRMPIPEANFEEALIMAEPTSDEGRLGRHMKAKGEGFFQFSIDVTDLAAELRRLRDKGIKVETEGDKLAWVAPEELNGIRVELRQS